MRRVQQEALWGLNSGERSKGKPPMTYQDLPKGQQASAALSGQCSSSFPEAVFRDATKAQDAVGFGKVSEWVRTSPSSFRHYQTHCEQ